MPTLNLVEGLAKKERASEAELIHRSFKLLKKGPDQRRTRHVKTRFVQPETKNEFLDAMQAECEYLHVSSHGERVEGGARIYVRNKGYVTAQDIQKLDIKAKVVFINACQAWSDDLRNAFAEAENSRPAYFIAPKNDVSFDEAYLIALLFYRGLILDKLPPNKALKNAYNLPRITGSYFCERIN